MTGKEITIGAKSYGIDSLSDNAKELLKYIEFVDMEIQQLQNELAIADTARFAYTNAFKREIQSR